MTNETLMTGDAASDTNASQGQQGATDNAAGAEAGSPAQQVDSTVTDPKAEGQKEGDASEGDKQDDAKQGAPEQYEFKFAEGVAIDADALKEFEAFAREKGLDQESAQAIADFGPKLMEKFAAKQIEAVEQQTNAWAEEAKADKEFGGDKLAENLSVAKKAVDAFGSPELKAMLGKFHPTENPKGTGLGNHPEIIRLLVKAGKAISEDTMVTQGGQQGTKMDPASILYPTMKK
jgi:hypothetical protein